MICRLRLWIELLKNAYYTESSKYEHLETLPNIDINIKCGNSLISRFGLDTDVSQMLKKSKWNIDAYQIAVERYKNAETKDEKREMEQLISTIKQDFRSEISLNDPLYLKLRKLNGELFSMTNQGQLFAMSDDEKKTWNQKLEKLHTESSKLETQIEEIKSNKIYDNSFEWRFEFPEVLDNDGNFRGFDLVIGNPPYVFARDNFTDSMKQYFINNYSTSQYQVNLYLLFIERIIPILKSNGCYSQIIPNSILMVSSAQKLRKEIMEKTSIKEIVNLLGNTFEGVGVETIILAGQKEIINKSNTISILTKEENEIRHTHSKAQETFSKNEGAELTVFSDDDSDEFTSKLKSNSILLDDLVKIKAGLKAYESGKGIPKQTPEMVKSRPYDFDSKIDDTTYEYLEGKDVGRYHLKWSGGFLKYGDNLASPRTFDLFNGRKIIIREITGKYPNSIIATYSEDIYLFNMSNIAIIEKENTTVSLKYILAILNSQLMSYYFVKNTAKSVRKLFPKLILEDLRKFPIKEISDKDQKPFIKLVDKILSLKKSNPNADASELEKEIDKMVYELYGLSVEEREIVEK